MKTRDARQEDAARIRRWLAEVMRITGKKATPLAREAGIAPSTLIRALDETGPTALSRASIDAIRQQFGVSGPDFLEQDGRLAPGPGFAEPDLTPLAEQPPSWCGEPLGPNDYVARVGGRALDLAGIVPGDEVLMAMDGTPAAGDVVQAQVYSAGNAETVLRIYDPPYLVARTTLPDAPKPLLVDGSHVRIAAVARRMSRSFKNL